MLIRLACLQQQMHDGAQKRIYDLLTVRPGRSINALIANGGNEAV